MRVLHVTPYFAPAFAYGGPPRSIFELCRALRHAGVDVRVVTTTANGATMLPASGAAADVYDGVPVRYCRLARPAWYFNAAVGGALDEDLRWCDVCHVHGVWNVPEWRATSRAARTGVPYVLSPRGMLEPRAVARGRWRKAMAYALVERRALRDAALLHATSAGEADTLRELAPAAGIVTLPNGVDLEAASRGPSGVFRRTARIAAGEPLIVFLGRLHPIKRLDLLAAAFGRVRAALPPARLVLAGRDEGGFRRTIEPLFAPFGAAVFWAGELAPADKWALLRDATVLVLCSDSESFGLSVAEALAAGVPAVVTRTCPWPDLDAWGCGSWVEQTPVAIGDALTRILRDPGAAAAMGERGRTVARARFDWTAIAAAMASHYGEVAGRRAERRSRLAS